MPSLLSGPWGRRPLVLALLLLAPLLAVSLFGRVLWTPDEPREADIAWRMSLHPPEALAVFDGQPWLEKPPLSYWLAAAAIDAFGDSPQAERLPNLLYLTVGAVAVFLLAASMVGAEFALVATLVAGSALLAWRVGIWLAPDAALMAGVAVALLGAWRGWSAPRGRAKLFGYTLMHAGAAWAFMAKSAVGWAVPALVLLTLMIWERRGRELARPELWAGFLLQLVVIVPWLLLVLRRPEGLADLRALFWNNLAGRFADVPTYGGLRYATGHRNEFGKYWLELPLYLLPWTALALAALARALRAARGPTAGAAAWRFALAVSLPWLLLLSFSATARDVYAAPALIGFALLVALRLADGAAPRALRVTLWTSVAAGVLLLAAGILLLVAGETAGDGPLAALLAIAVMLVVAVRECGRALRADSRAAAAVCCHVAWAAALVLWGLAFFPVIDGWQDLAPLAGRITRDAGAQPLGLFAPDETTIAMMDHPYGHAVVVQPAHAGPAALTAGAARWLDTHGAGSRLLVKLPGSAPGPLSRWLATHTGRRLWSDDDGVAAALVRGGAGRIVARYELPEGRRFALLAPATGPAARAAPRP